MMGKRPLLTHAIPVPERNAETLLKAAAEVRRIVKVSAIPVAASSGRMMHSYATQPF